jgi:hypothetical protein
MTSCPDRQHNGARFSLAFLRWARRRWQGLALGSTLLAGGLLCDWLWPGWRTTDEKPSSALVAPADPRLGYAGPFLNVHPDVQFVGDAACAKCHAKIADSYRAHPMGRSLMPVAQWLQEAQQKIEGASFDVAGYRYSLERSGDRLFQHKARLDALGHVVFQQEFEVHYVIGSGTRGLSFLNAESGHLLEAPISWYSQKKVWDLSPGFKEHGLTTRPVIGMCLGCHANLAHYEDGTLNGYREPIFTGHAVGCERCHGPGEKHIKAPGQNKLTLRTQAGKPVVGDPTIVNPGKLEPALRDAVCQQCHLQGSARVLRAGRGIYDFRPGLPAEEFWAVFLKVGGSDADPEAVSHAEQMNLSGCFQKSAEPAKLSCISCHDAHRQPAPEEREAFYRDRCLKCHTESSCNLPVRERQVKRDSCIECHMPRHSATDVPHVAVTDHRIPRRPNAAAKSSRTRAVAGNLPMAPFFEKGFNLDNMYDARDMGFAMVKSIMGGKLEPAQVDRALRLLEKGTSWDVDDPEGLEAKANGLVLKNNLLPALAIYQHVLEQLPRREIALSSAAIVASKIGKNDLALGFLRRAIDINPGMADYRKAIIQVMGQMGRYQEAVPHCRALLNLEPQDLRARLMWVEFLLRERRVDEARREFAVIEALQPEGLPQLRDWFRKLSS